MKKIILISNLVGFVFFFWFVANLSSEDPTAGGLAFIIFIVPFLFIMTLINVILYVIFRVLKSKDKVRACPACAHVVSVGLTSCGQCGFDFMKAAGN